MLINILQASSLLIKRKAEKAEKPEKPNSSLKISRPFLTTAKVDTAGRTSMGSLCAYGALNQIVVGADRGTTPISFAEAWHLPYNLLNISPQVARFTSGIEKQPLDCTK